MSGATSINVNFHKQLDRTGEGKTKLTLNNLVRILELAPAFSGLWGWDEWRGQYVLTRIPPWGGLGRKAPCVIMDDDVLFLRSAIEQMDFVEATFTTNMAWDAIKVVCRKNSFDEIKTMLNATEWDGVPRIDSWVIDYLGARDSPANRTICRKWIISAIARALRPGCQADHMLILEGKQGIGKSSALRVLFGEYLGKMPDPTHKHAGMDLQGVWVCESSEMASMSKSESSHLKAFLTEVKDVFRVPYERMNTIRPRRCVFAATTNHSNYLKDPTGERRIWPVTLGVTGPLDLVGLAAARLQLFAEARAALEAGEAWHPSREEEQAIGGKHEPRRAPNSIRDALDEWTCGGTRPGFTFLQAIQDGLHLNGEGKDFSASLQHQVATALKELKYELKRSSTDDRKYFYYPENGR